MGDQLYLPRIASGLLERAVVASPVVVLMGARPVVGRLRNRLRAYLETLVLADLLAWRNAQVPAPAARQGRS